VHIDHTTHTIVQADIGTVTLRTTALSPFLWQLGRRFERFWQWWFRWGLYAAMPCGLVCILYLFYNAFAISLLLLRQQFASSSSSSLGSSQPAVDESVSSVMSSVSLVVVIPGVNVPIAHVPFILLALLVSAAFHELGHAICASSEKCKVDEVGFLLYFCLPSAYVSLNSDDMEGKMISSNSSNSNNSFDIYNNSNSTLPLSNWQKLKIYCAGVWHNILLCILATVLYYLLIPNASGTIYNSLLFERAGIQNEKGTTMGVFAWRSEKVLQLTRQQQQQQYALVDTIFSNSNHELADEKLLTRLNDCQLENATSWDHCLNHIFTDTTTNGYLIPDDEMYQQAMQNAPACCRVNSAMIESNEGDNTVKPSDESNSSGSYLCTVNSRSEEQCVRARELIKFERCAFKAETSKPLTMSELDALRSTMRCVVPRESAHDKFVKLVEIHSGDTTENSRLYIGDVRSFVHEIKVTSVKPRNLFSRLFLFWVHADSVMYSIDSIAYNLNYIFAFSSALAMLNMLPIPHLDGNLVFETLLQMDSKSKSSRNQGLVKLVKWTSIALIVFNFGIGLAKALFYS